MTATIAREEIVSFMDLLDLDEEVIDARLKSIMVKPSCTNKQLGTAIHLLRYKQLINLKEDTECDNEEECNFVAKLINEVQEENVENVCKIINIALNLSPSTVVCKSEHLLQQLLSNVDVLAAKTKGMAGDTAEQPGMSNALLSFKLCDSIIDAVLDSGQKLELPFLETPLESILSSTDEKVKVHFLTKTVPRFFQGIIGYNILDRIWKYLKEKQMAAHKNNVLKVLNCLSEYYLPVPDSKGLVKFESDVVFQFEFWSVILYGLQSNDPSMRRIPLYLAKRAVDCLMALEKDVCINSETEAMFSWQQKDQRHLKTSWGNFFILIDSLEEKQSSIVLPSLQLFDKLQGIEKCWIICAFNIGLKHENAQVRLNCVDYKLRGKLDSEAEALLLLESLNDINLYDNPKDCNQLNCKLSAVLEDVNTFLNILKATPKIKWSPVPWFHITKVLSSIKQKEIISAVGPAQLTQIIIDILKVPCNNIVVRKGVKLNVAYFLTKSCRSIEWKELLKIYSAIGWDTLTFEHGVYNPFTSMIRQLYLNKDEQEQFFESIATSHHYIDFALTYLDKHDNDMMIVLNVINERIKKLQDIVNRQYSDKTECFNEFVFLTNLYQKTSKKDTASKEFINVMISREHKMFIQYVASIISSNVTFTSEERAVVFNGFCKIAEYAADSKEDLLNLYKSAVLLINDSNTDMDNKVNAVFILEGLKTNTALTVSYKHEMLDLKQTLKLTGHLKFNSQNVDNVGRLRNAIYEKLCELIFHLLKEQTEIIKDNLKELIDNIENVVECGGYGCLKWVLKIINEILPFILNDENIEFNVVEFIGRMWKEIEELKSNHQYTPCIEEFVNLITQDSLINKAMYNNVVVLYCTRIIDYGQLKNTPLFYLAQKLNEIEITEDLGHIIYVLSEMLLFSPVPRKDQRIADNAILEILQDPNYGFKKDGIDVHFNYEIQLLSVSTLCKITKPEILETTLSLIIKRIEEIFATKLRYHGNSQLHRTLLIGLQHLLLAILINPKIVGSGRYLTWSLEFFGRLPHQPSVRICLEWCIALHLYAKNVILNEELVELLKVNNIPVTSQFMILYWVLKHRVAKGNYKKAEYEHVLDTLLSHTMGQLFNTRLSAQFLASKLFEFKTQDCEKYAYIVEVIKKTFIESSKDKNFVRLNEDFFVNNFDIVAHLTPCFIYYYLPRHCDISNNENVEVKFFKSILQGANDSILKNANEDPFIEEWKWFHKTNDQVFEYNLNRRTESNEVLKNEQVAGTIQKKYVPWNNMSDIDTFECGKKKESSSELIVVASLINKLPNLGGMARTSEVFGVKNYVVDSLRHLQDNMFQSLSVSAERWVNVEEVRPGAPLKEYLRRMKAEGYSVVAAEQTSTSAKLQTFKFPKKTLLLLGHEKDGIPCDLLPMMDHCVEIPQQGFVRSLNVHVTAAIFIWEYSRQNIL